MRRIATAAVTVPLALAAVFFLPDLLFFLLLLMVIELAVLEYSALVDRTVPRGPHRVLLFLVPMAAMTLTPDLWPRIAVTDPRDLLWVWFLIAAMGLGCLVVWWRMPTDLGLASLGAIAYGLPYLALPLASIYHLRREDPWVLVLLFAIVWLGDTAAYYCGRAWGRRKLAPVVSPNKTWVGAIASLLAAMVAAGVWSLVRLGVVRVDLLALAMVTSVAAQMGDLVESLIKRGAGVKDSGSLLPGHGGVLDRVDALLFAAPVMCLGLRWVEQVVTSP